MVRQPVATAQVRVATDADVAIRLIVVVRQPPGPAMFAASDVYALATTASQPRYRPDSEAEQCRVVTCSLLMI